jgi:DNA-binding NtrC family response regulator
MARILVIDDEADVRELLEETLRSLGHSVVLATNGKEGLNLHRANPVHLVITDIFMPEKEGLETIRDFRREFPGVVLIAMSGRPDLANALFLAQQLGAYRVLEKPFDRQDLLAAIADALQACA